MFKKLAKDPELVGGVKETRNWGGIVISLLVIVIICTLIVIAALIVSPRITLQIKFTFDDIFNETFQEKKFDAQWIDDRRYVRLDEGRHLMLYDISSTDTIPIRRLMHRRVWDVNEVNSFKVSPDERFILLTCKKKRHFRRSEVAIYKIFSIRRQKMVDSLNTRTSLDPTAERFLRYAAWTPKDSSLVFVDLNNDIYYRRSVLSSSNQNSTRLTHTGKPNLIFNGVPDWVYGEDVLDSDNAIYWHENGTKMVFATFDDNNVNTSWIPVYTHHPYPVLHSIPYPLPGYPLPSVMLQIVNLESSNSPDFTEITPPTEVLNMKEYLYKYVVWVNSSWISVTWMNRVQNHSITSLCSAESGLCEYILLEEEQKNGWVVMRGPPVFSEYGDNFAVISPLSIDKGEVFYYHACVWTGSQSTGERIVYTDGRFEVIKILAFKNNYTLYYLANKNATWNRHLYSTRRKDMYSKGETTCLSCDINENCTFFDAYFMPHSDQYILYCKGWTTPVVTLHTIGEHTYSVLEDNSEMKNAVFSQEHVVQKWGMIPVDGREIPVRLLESNTKDESRLHPLLINLNGGLEKQRVTSEFYQGWLTYLISQHHFIVVDIDTRGAPYYGQDYLLSIYKKIGQAEIEDINYVIQYLSKANETGMDLVFNETLIDKNRVAAFGIGINGYLAALLQSRSDLFNCTIAVAPVTDWRLYSSVFSERYMGLLTENLQGYQDSNISAEAQFFRNSSFFLIHGMADSNVHFQHSANLVSALLDADIDHTTIFYPKEDHYLFDDVHNRKSLYRKMTGFLLETFNMEK